MSEDVNLNKLRARLLGEDPEQAAYYRGRVAADKVISLLRRDGLLPPKLEGYYEHEDSKFKQSLRTIASSLGIEPRVTYNPGSSIHVSLAGAFPEARTIFLDMDNSAIEDVKKAGFEGYVGDMHTFELPDEEKADIVLILNAGYMESEQLDKVVSPNGVVIVNNWHGAKDYMEENCPDYQITAITSPEVGEFNVYGMTPEDTNTLYAFVRTT